MFLWVHFPPEFFAKVFCFIAHALQIVEVFSGDAFQYFPHTGHGDEGELGVYA